MNTLEKLRALAALEAAAAALRVDLKETAARTFAADGVSVSWKTPEGTAAVGSMTRDRCEIADPDEFLTWLVEHHPQLVHTVVQIRNPDVVKKMLEDWARLGPGPGAGRCPTCDAPAPHLHPATASEGEVAGMCADPFHAGAPAKLSPGESWSTAAKIPGVTFVKGGLFRTLSVEIDSSLKRRLASAARTWAAGARSSVFDVEAFVADAYGDNEPLDGPVK